MILAKTNINVYERTNLIMLIVQALSLPEEDVIPWMEDFADFLKMDNGGKNHRQKIVLFNVLAGRRYAPEVIRFIAKAFSNTNRSKRLELLRRSIISEAGDHDGIKYR